MAVGGSFMPAMAATEATDAPVNSPSASASATSSETASDSALQAKGLEEAVQRDLGKTVEEFDAETKVSEEAAELREKLNGEGIKASASVKHGRAEIKVGQADEAKAKKIAETTAAKATAITTGIGKIKTVNDVYEEVLANVKPTELSRLTAIMNTGSGLQIMADGPASTDGKESASPGTSSAVMSLTLEEFADQAKGVQLVEGSGPAKTTAENDFFGAMGYMTDRSGIPTPSLRLCSSGFNAWSPSGGDAIITAGHCAEDGQTKVAAIAEQSAPNVLEAIGAPLGSFGFNQFGGPNNSGIPLEDLEGLSDEEALQILGNTEPGTDIAVIDEINPELNLPAVVSNWPAAGPREGSVKVTGVSKAVVGANACSSGRTTGWSCSEIIGEGLFFVLGYNNDQRAVLGYAAKNPNRTILNQGDSGGPVLVGSRAIGINSANSPGPDGVDGNFDDLAFYTSLSDVQSKGYIDGYQIKLFINAPELTSVANGAQVEPGAAISGTMADASSGTKVNVIVDGQVAETVAVDPAGGFSFTAPQALGEFSFTLEAVNGRDKSEQVSGNVVVAAAEPTPTTPEPTDTATPSESSGSSQDPSESASASATASTSASATEPTKDEPKRDDTLADTGVGSMPLIIAGGALALIGAAVLLLRRSARRHG
ncbi:hypothetical protein AA310_07545 [Arthrobacter sp. YC-RL1]|nr:hypothetical protein ATC04_10360 [Arthrobacter sp. YC-RL1]KLI87789.1 hypothetical protein AA310_07545 [Arthrobacter sp. YC-RL1]